MGKISHEIFKNFKAKKLEIFSLGAFVSRVVGEYLSKCPNSKQTPLP